MAKRAIRTTFKVLGLKELGDALEELKTATARNVLRRTLQNLAEPIVEDAQANVRPHRRSGGLEKSIKKSPVKFTTGAAGKAAFAEAMRGGATRAEAGAAAREANASAKDSGLSAHIVMGPDRRPYAHMLEFGTAHMGPAPYMRPAWDSKGANAIDEIAKELGSEIKKAADRAAKKALRASRK